jgi:hypothetical protein
LRLWRKPENGKMLPQAFSLRLHRLKPGPPIWLRLGIRGMLKLVSRQKPLKKEKKCCRE